MKTRETYIPKNVEETEAIQWTGENLPDVLRFTGKHPAWDHWFKDWLEYDKLVRDSGNVFKLFTGLLGDHTKVLPTDWIIKDRSGVYLKLTDEEFMKHYFILQELNKS